MTSAELISILSKEPDSEVLLFWDGDARGRVEAVYESQGGIIVLAGEWSRKGGYDQKAANPKRIIWEQ